MLRLRAALALLCLAAAPAPAPVQWPTNRFTKWPRRTGPLSFPLPPVTQEIIAAGMTVRLERMPCGDGRPLSEACGDYYVNAAIKPPGGAPVRLEGAAGLSWWVGIGRLRPRDARPSLILVADMGGSGGCVTLDVVRPEGAVYRARRARLDGSTEICSVDPAKLAWPRDLTGHRRAELLLNDSRFACHFASCAGSWTPPRVLALEGSRLVDVSADPALAPLFRADMARAKAACERDATEPAAPCAAYAADAARLGRLPEARAFVNAQVRRGCRVAVRPCYDINNFPAGFEADLTKFLRRTGFDGPPTGEPLDSAYDRAAARLGLKLLPATKSQ